VTRAVFVRARARLAQAGLLCALLLAGCGARFVDERRDAADAAVVDAAELADTDAGEQTVAFGVFVQAVQSGGDTGSGSVSIVRRSDGSEVALFGPDFQSTPVPAPQVVLTSRSAIGTGGIQPGTDLALGALTSSRGAQSYVVPGGDGGRRNLFVWCATYGTDVTVAHLQ